MGDFVTLPAGLEPTLYGLEERRFSEESLTKVSRKCQDFRMAKQLWPLIKERKNPGGKISYMVDLGLVNGQRPRKFFSTKAEALTYAEQCRTARKNEGRNVFDLGQKERVEAVECLRILEPFGKSLRDAVDFYLPHLKASNRTCTVGQLMREIGEAKKKDGKSRRYLEDLRSRLGQFSKVFGDRTVSGITSAEVASWLRDLSVGALTRNNFRRVLVTAFNFAVENGYASANPAETAAKAKQVETNVEILTVKQTVALLERAKEDILPAIAIGAFAGLRRAEIERLDWADVKLAAGFIEVKASKAKSARRRLIKIRPNLAAWIAPYAKQNGAVPPSTFRVRMDQARSAAGITEWPQNALRHSFASYHLAHFENAAELALELGHTNAQLIFAHYRQLVEPKDAAHYWNIMPSRAGKEKVVAFAAS